MQLSTRRDGETIHVGVAGELDFASGRKLDTELRRVLVDGAVAVRLDLSECTFIDSAGLGVLLRWREDAEAQGRRFEVTGVRGTVRRVFRVTGMLEDADRP